MTQSEPPHEANHWTARGMAAASGLAVSTMQEIWKKHRLVAPLADLLRGPFCSRWGYERDAFARTATSPPPMTSRIPTKTSGPGTLSHTSHSIKAVNTITE